jgi:hypothetical protein
MQCKTKCKTTWSFLSAKTFRFPTSATRQHHILMILTVEHICNHRNVRLWNINIMCLTCGVTKWEAHNAWSFPTVLHCTPTWQGQALNMKNQPYDWFTDVKNLCLATFKITYIISWHLRNLTVIIQHHILSPTGEQNWARRIYLATKNVGLMLSNKGTQFVFYTINKTHINT